MSRSRSGLLCLWVGVASLLGMLAALAPPALAGERPKRKPAEGGEWKIDASVVESHLDVPTGALTGVIWFQNDGGRKYSGESSLVLRATDGSEIALPAPAFELDADEDVKGAAEDYAGAAVARDLLARAATSSDFSLLPLRAMQWHQMPFAGGKQVASKSMQAVGQSVEWNAEKLDTVRFNGNTHDQYFTRSVRRFQASGFEIHDYIFTCEYESAKDAEHYVAFGCGYRAFVHPTLKAKDGKRPDGGLFLLVRFKAARLDWDRAMGKGNSMVPPADEANLVKKADVEALDALFSAMQDEGIGDPFDSPALALLRRTGAFDRAAATRFVNMGSPKPMAMIVPLLVEKGLEVDGTKFRKLWSAADDPVHRLLYAAGAQLGGKGDAAFRQEAKLATGSTDARVLRAALVLANALSDPLLVADAEAALASAVGSK